MRDSNSATARPNASNHCWTSASRRQYTGRQRYRKLLVGDRQSCPIMCRLPMAYAPTVLAALASITRVSGLRSTIRTGGGYYYCDPFSDSLWSRAPTSWCRRTASPSSAGTRRCRCRVPASLPAGMVHRSPISPHHHRQANRVRTDRDRLPLLTSIHGFARFRICRAKVGVVAVEMVAASELHDIEFFESSFGHKESLSSAP